MVFASNDTSTLAYHVLEEQYLKIDGIDVQDLVDEPTLRRFANEGAFITSNPLSKTFSKSDIQKKFKKINNLLRQEGLRSGEERFTAIADLLFLKLISEDSAIGETLNRGRFLSKKYQWDALKSKSPIDMVDYLNDSIRPRLVDIYGSIFETNLKIQRSDILYELINEIDSLNLNDTDTDIKGDAFEFFLRNMTNENKDLGEYYTPRHIIKMILSLIQPKFGDKVYDGFCGTGGFLIEAFKYLSLRVDMSDEHIRKKLKTDTVFGSELTSTSRITKMNMILYGDGHSNIEKRDTLANPISEKFDIAISNIPYSQKTTYGHYYDLSTKNADPVCVMHLWNSLREGGKLAVIVPETFLYEKDATESVRKKIFSNSSQLTIISLPRGVFNPYTPVKTSIVIATKQKQSTPDKTFFFIIDQDGFELGARRRPIYGESDINKIKFYYEEKVTKAPKACDISTLNDNYSFLPFDYMEDIPFDSNKLTQLDKLAKPRAKKKLEEIIDDLDDSATISILEISQKGIFVNEEVRKDQLDFDKYKKHILVYENEVVFNPHRINVGSIGKVYSFSSIMIVSPIYEIFSFNDVDLTNFYLTTLKSGRYKQILSHYSIGGARPLLTYNRLSKVRLPMVSKEKREEIAYLSRNVDETFELYVKSQSNLNKLITNNIETS